MGTAYAVTGPLVSSLDVRFTLGGIDKRLRIFGERIWERGVLGAARLSSPRPFDVMPIRYERSFGGWDFDTLKIHENIGSTFVTRWERDLLSKRSIASDFWARAWNSPNRLIGVHGGIARHQPASGR